VFDGIDPKSATPLYEQIASYYKAQVASGRIAAGDPLPSVRQLAARLRINPATVSQAYRSLEAEGFAESRQGSGTFVRTVGTEQRGRERALQARRLVRDLLADAVRAGVSVRELKAALDDVMKEGRP
jgi:GntR family transcriptional regulator